MLKNCLEICHNGLRRRRSGPAVPAGALRPAAGSEWRRNSEESPRQRNRRFSRAHARELDFTPGRRRGRDFCSVGPVGKRGRASGPALRVIPRRRPPLLRIRAPNCRARSPPRTPADGGADTVRQQAVFVAAVRVAVGRACQREPGWASEEARRGAPQRARPSVRASLRLPGASKSAALRLGLRSEAAVPLTAGRPGPGDSPRQKKWAAGDSCKAISQNITNRSGNLTSAKLFALTHFCGM